MSAEERRARLEAGAREVLGKRLEDCDRGDLLGLVAHFSAVAVVVDAETDRAHAALTDAEGCPASCRFEVPRRPDGTADIGRARIRHSVECGRENFG